MDKEKILNIIKKCSTFDVDGNVKYVDVLEYDMLANKLLEAINVTHCCMGEAEQLPKNNCTLNRQTCGKGSGCKYPHCHI